MCFFYVYIYRSILDVPPNQESASFFEFERLPLEVITKIVSYMSEKDLNSLARVNKIWRTTYLNQNTIWMKICHNLNIQLVDYYITDFGSSRENDPPMNANKVPVDTFGTVCKYWTLYKRYQTVANNILNNQLITIHLTNKRIQQTFCTDSYMICINRKKKQSIYVRFLRVSRSPSRFGNLFLKEFNLYKEFKKNENYNIKIVGNNRFLVLEIHSVIFVYIIQNNKFILKFSKIIRKAVVNEDGKDDDENDNVESLQMGLYEDFLHENEDTKIDLCGNKLMLVQPSKNLMFLINLTNAKIIKEKVFFEKKCTVDAIKCDKNRLMIGVSIKVNCNYEFLISKLKFFF